MKKRNALHLVLMALLIVAVFVTACSNNANNTNETNTAAEPSESTDNAGTAEPETEKALEPVELTYYFPGTPQKDMPAVEEAMNKILTEKINATIKLNLIDWGSFEQKINVMSAAGDNHDLVFTAPWMNNYYQNVAKGALLPLDELLDQYAPTLKATVPANIWDATRVDGKIYGAINWQIVAMPYGFAIVKEFADKYNLDLSTINKYEDLEPFFDQIIANENGVTPVAYSNTYDIWSAQPPYFGMDSIGDDSSVGWYYLDQPEVKVINQFASQEFKQFVELMYKWNQKGYVRKDAGSVTDYTADMKAGKFAAANIAFPVKPGGEAELTTRYAREFVAKALSKPVITSGRAIATMTGISKSSKNPERAMMFLELINSDKELYNLLAHGIEGKHFVITDKENGVIGLPEGVQAENVGYTPGTDWMFGNQFNGYYTNAADVGNWEKTIQLNKDAEVSKLLGFNFNPESVKAEQAQTSSVIKQYLFALTSGTSDPAKVLPEFLEKLSNAGADKIIAEKQKQIDAWLKSK